MTTRYYWVKDDLRYPQGSKSLRYGDKLYINPSEDTWRSLGFELVAEEIDDTPAPQERPYSEDIVTALLALNKEVIIALDDETASGVAALFPAWADRIGEALHAGERYYYDGSLYKVIQDHTAQSEWTPAVATSLFAAVNGDASADGSLEHPIAWQSGMECEHGLYYTEGGNTYRCIRDSGTPLYFAISALLGTYFEAV